MADNNIDTNSMAGKVVAILIALLFIVVLAFPIANALGNGSGESGGGGGGETVTVSNENNILLWDITSGGTTYSVPSYMSYGVNPVFRIDMPASPILYMDLKHLVIANPENENFYEVWEVDDFLYNFNNDGINRPNYMESDGEKIIFHYPQYPYLDRTYEIDIVGPCYYADRDGDYGIYLNPTLTNAYSSLYVPSFTDTYTLLDRTPNSIPIIQPNDYSTINQAYYERYGDYISNLGVNPYLNIANNQITDAGWDVYISGVQESSVSARYLVLPNTIEIQPYSPILLNTLADEFCTPDITYISYSEDYTQFQFNTSDLNNLINIFDNADYSEYSSLYNEIYDEDMRYIYPIECSYTGEEVVFYMSFYYIIDGGDEYSQGMYVNINANDEWTIDAPLSNLESFSIAISNSHISVSFTDSDSNQDYSWDSPLDWANYVSMDESGVVPFDSKDYLEKIAIGSVIYLAGGNYTITKDMISDNRLILQSYYPITDENDSRVTGIQQIIFELQSTDIDGVYQFAPSVKTWNEEYQGFEGISAIYLTLDGTDVTEYNGGGDIYDPGINDISCSGYILSDSSSDSTGSGGGTASGVGGVAGTLIKLVPILMIVGLLMMFIVPMVYKPN